MKSRESKHGMAQRVANFRSARDALRTRVHQNMYNLLQSLQAEGDRLGAAIQQQTGAERAETESRLREVDKQTATVRDELVAQAGLTLRDLDQEIASLETSARATAGEARAMADKARASLQKERDQICDKAQALRTALGDRLRYASAEYDRAVKEFSAHYVQSADTTSSP